MTTAYSKYSYWASILLLSINYSFFWMLVFNSTYKSRNLLFLAISYLVFFKTLNLNASLFLWPFILVAHWAYSENDSNVPDTKLIIYLGLISSALFYVRFFYGLLGLFTFGAYFFSRFIIDKKYHFSLIFYNDVSLYSYLKINSQLSFGNSVDMTLDLKNNSQTFLSVFVVFIILNIYLLFRKRSLLLTVNLLLLVLFKLGFSRTDHYLGYFVFPIAVISLIMIFEKNILGRILFLLMLGTLYYLANSANIYNMRLHVFNQPINWGTDYKTRMANIYQDYVLKKNVVDYIGDATIDVYPYNNEYAFANKFNYLHRPLFQNYMTLTPTLDSMNKKFFESPMRPRFILWTAAIGCQESTCNPFSDLDNKYVLNQDPLTTTSILSNYHIAMETVGKNNIPILLLEKNNKFTEASETILAEKIMNFNQWYEIPSSDSGVIKIRPNFQFTLAAHLKNSLFRGNVVNIFYKLYTGEIKSQRINVLNASNGIWVSPLLNQMSDSGFAGDKIESIMFTTSDSGYFKPSFKASFINFKIPDSYSQKNHLDEVIPVATLVSKAKSFENVTCQGSIDSAVMYPPDLDNHSVDKYMNLTGWLARSTLEGTLFESIFVTITDDKGNKTYFPTYEHKRADVADYFKQKQLAAAGFGSTITLAVIKGEYRIGLAGYINNKVYNCTNLFTPLVIK
jgi:hypothetical protein